MSKLAFDDYAERIANLCYDSVESEQREQITQLRLNLYPVEMYGPDVFDLICGVGDGIAKYPGLSVFRGPCPLFSGEPEIEDGPQVVNFREFWDLNLSFSFLNYGILMELYFLSYKEAMMLLRERLISESDEPTGQRLLRLRLPANR